MKEIPEYPFQRFPQHKPSGANCPTCNAPMVYGLVRCPDGKPGCLVNHFGYVCTAPMCGKQWA